MTGLVVGQRPPLQAELQQATSRLERVKTVAQASCLFVAAAVLPTVAVVRPPAWKVILPMNAL